MFPIPLRNLTALRKSGQSSGFRWLLAFLSGALLAVSCFPEFNLPWFAWVAPGLILWASYDYSVKSTFRNGWLAGVGYCLVSFYWLLLIPFPVYGVLAWVALSAGLAIYFALWCVLCRLFLPKKKAPEQIKEEHLIFAEIWQTLTWRQQATWALCCAAAWVAMEMAAGGVLTDYPLISLGATQCRLLPLIQIASVTGVYGVSFLVGWFSISLVGSVIFLRGGKLWRRAVIQVLPPGLAVVCVLVFGLTKMSEAQNGSERLKIALVQPSFPERVIWDPNEETNRFLKLMDLSRAALAAKPDLLVWPEAALPEIIGRNRYTQESIGNLVRPAQVWMVMGIVDVRPRPGAPGKYEAFNSAFLVDPNGDLTGTYDKTHLMVFGEYMPWWARHLPFLARLRSAAELSRGGQLREFRTSRPGATFPVCICFEDCFPGEIRGRVHEDTDFILNLTNDGWFGKSAAQWQHAVTALFRAVENGVPLVRCCNNGLTCWIDERGRMHDVYFQDSDNIYQEGYKLVEVPLRSSSAGQRTFYNRWGDLFGWLCVGIMAAAITVNVVYRRGNSTSENAR